MPKSKDEKIKVLAQISGFKMLRIEGGWRLNLDLFDARPQDVAIVSLLANKRENLKITIEPENGGKEKGKDERE